ncbi:MULTISPECIES: glycoside hydrolase family 25 protein [Phyllobacterium]|uniref:Lysozyme M1 (1,4-beta-N-acetylmuramidase) n=1 Tax=Phyllobacterium sophorae TaxID=1520277 RepID=A0A2P7B475_9HYPH|nr:MULTISPECIES: GH25 family lysozyme [Phyllobacterium]PSH61275.1 lysozyme M1 (1,4-beta-N-acetylmuramidase) [Phyllobacterium sophorae]UXN63328.1 GH25 family lysozyme [Phyllobacterium sp. A18/5-2]
MTIGVRAFALVVAALFSGGPTFAESEFQSPWSNKERAIVLDGYEQNSFNLAEIVRDERVAGFIHKGSDGMPANYHCTRIRDPMQQELCKRIWRNYSVSRELYQTRRALAKALGLKWGAYHLGRPGNPIEQANHFIDYTEPTADELIAIDIENNDPEKFMSLRDAEIFAEHVKFRAGRYPILYTNGITAKYIADHRLEFPILSRLPLWYARYESDIAPHFPKGNWQDYALWQFTSQSNCNKQRCPYRPPGTNRDIDVNIADMTVPELKRAWPFGELVKAIPPNDLPKPDTKPVSQPNVLVASARPLLTVNSGGKAAVDGTMTASVLLQPISRFRAKTLTVDALSASLSRSVAHQMDHINRYPIFAVSPACLKKVGSTLEVTDLIRHPALTPFL